MDTITLKKSIIDIFKKQKNKKPIIEVDILLNNGNIILKSFRMYEYIIATDLIKGLTMHEEYAYLREKREPVFAYFNVYEIKNLEILHSNYLFLSKPIHLAI